MLGHVSLYVGTNFRVRARVPTGRMTTLIKRMADVRGRACIFRLNRCILGCTDH
jgi:hypothetical protein